MALSADEEIVAFLLTGAQGVNDLARQHRSTKVSRAVLRSEGLRTKLGECVSPVWTDSGLTLPTLEFDRARLQRVIFKIAKGLYYHLTDERLDGERVFYLGMPSMLLDDVEATRALAMVERLFPRMGFSCPVECTNPDVFCFDAVRYDRPGSTTIFFRFTFYGGVHIRVVVCDRFIETGPWLGVARGRVAAFCAPMTHASALNRITFEGAREGK